MSRHHVDQRWSSFTRKRRAELEAQLPLRCISKRCIRGGIVHPDPPAPAGMVKRRSSWQVGHIVDAARGGRPTRENTGPIHTVCNQRDGGQLGAAVTNRKRQSNDRGITPWL